MAIDGFTQFFHATGNEISEQVDFDRINSVKSFAVEAFNTTQICIRKFTINDIRKPTNKLVGFLMSFIVKAVVLDYWQKMKNIFSF
jgi:hypothetical protein